MENQKKKLRLDELKVESFVTNVISYDVRGAGYSCLYINGICDYSNQNDPLPKASDHCTSPGLPNTQNCYSYLPCGNLPTKNGANTCDDVVCPASDYTCNGNSTCDDAYCYGGNPA